MLASMCASMHPLAYLDGGTGSMLLQAALAGILSGAYVLKTRWAQFKSFIAVRVRKTE